MDLLVRLSPIEPWRSPVLMPPSRPSAYYALLAASLALVVFALIRSRRAHLVQYWPLGRALLLALPAPLLSLLLVLQLWPGDYSWLTGGAGVRVPLVALVAVSLAATRGRPLEVALVGLASSAGVALWHSHSPLTFLEGAYYGVILNSLLTQSYRGQPYSLLRQPAFAAPLAALATWPVLLLSSHSVTFGPLLTGLFTAANRSFLEVGLFVVQAGLAGLLVQSLYLAGMRRPVPVPSRPGPHTRSMRARLLAAYLPVAALCLLAVLTLLINSAIGSASRWAFDEAARDASSAAQRLARALEQGQESLRLLSAEADLGPPGEAEALELYLRLHRDLSALLLVRGGEVVAGATPESEPGVLTPLEQEALADLAPQAEAVTSMHRDEGGPLISLISAEGPSGRLLGRMRPPTSQVWQDIVGDLQWTVDAGNGFVVDEQRRILAHPDATYVLTMWDARPRYARVYATGTGAAYDAPDSAGVRHLVYVLPIGGYPWQVVIEVPTEVVYRQAIDLALPSLLLTVALAAIGTLLVLVAAWRYSRPLTRLATVAGEIAAGDLTVPADVGGHDEIGHLGRSFEEMRLALQRRLNDLTMLLDVTQSVSASYAWSFRPILEAVNTGTDAVASCLCLVESGLSRPVAREGSFEGWLDILPGMEQVAREAQRQRRPLPVSSVVRYFRGVSGQTLAAEARSAVCMPLVAGERDVGVMWAVYSQRRHLDDQDIRLLHTLAAQAAVIYENSRLLTEAQSERGRLRAILASTADPIVVVDQDGGLVLANPSAERILQLGADARGPKRTRALQDPALRVLVDMPLRQSCVTRELHLDSGVTMSAAVSPIALEDGGSSGRVIVLRDVTELKQREREQADLVTHLSRHVREPLRQLLGYAIIIRRMGDLTPRQADALERIERNTRPIQMLLDNLVDLNSIERGEGVHLEPCGVPGAVEAALSALRAEFDRRGHNLRRSLPSNSSVVYADKNLLVRAIHCLADNAAKYTAGGGTIGVQVFGEDEGVVIAVTDTGIGISPAEQMRIFDRFYRVDRPEVHEVPGHGLGLPIVKAIADWHGGRVWVESEPGHGSRFCLWLPSPPGSR
ncbi:MAG: HAMP domain-containing protein [Anaerolineae bacterium]|nr:HAMP domain-containing protein [Anaerolineae bacterium]